MGHGGHVPPLLQMAGHGGGTVSRKTANKKLAQLYWPSRKRSPKQLIVLLEPKIGGARPTKFFWRFAPERCPSPTFAPDQCPHFQIRSGATASYHSYFIITRFIAPCFQRCGSLFFLLYWPPLAGARETLSFCRNAVENHCATAKTC